MNNQFIHPAQSTKFRFIEPETQEAWLVILLLALVTIVGIFAAASITRYVFPAGCFVVGVFLYKKYPAMYLSFNWWLYFLSPFLARLVDMRSSWDPQRTLVIAPLLVTSISVLTFLQYFPKYYRRGGYAFVLPAASVIYAVVIGLINDVPFAVFRGMLDWLPAIFLGFHIFVNWRHYPQYRQNTQRTFLWGALVMGSYAIVQYLILPEWDRSWLIDSTMFTSAGNPAPFEVRVWSTMHAPGAYAIAIMAGLLVLLTCKGPLCIPANIIGYLSFLLTLVRSSWGSWMIGVLLYISALKPHKQMRLFVTISILLVSILPLTAMEPFATRIGSRLQTLSDLGNDGSLNERAEITAVLLNAALAQLVGRGMSNRGVDNGFIELLLVLGWIGTITYLVGCIGLLLKIAQIPKELDSFVNVSQAICFCMAAQIVFGVPFKGIGGVVFWVFGGLALAADEYQKHSQANLQVGYGNALSFNSYHKSKEATET